MSTGNFAATRWTLVVQAKGDDEAARGALSELCAAYYAPVLAFLRMDGRPEDAAREMAHEFFAKVLAGNSLGGADPAHGRFRSYLLGAVKHFLGDQRDRGYAAKRGGGIVPEPLDHAEDSTPGWQVPGLPQDETAFDRQWALTVIARALEAVNAEWSEAGKQTQFEVLKPWLTGEVGAPPQAQAAQQLGMGESAVKVAIHRLRQRFREVVKLEIAQTVPVESDVDDELRHLIAVLAR